jgi:cell division protein FtsW
MARKLKTDRVLFVAAFLLVCTSIVMVYSASAALSLQRHGDADYLMMRQALWAVLGMAVLAIAMRIDYRTYRNDALAWTLVGSVGLLLVLALSFGPEVNGARRWLDLGGLRFQPSEAAKIACVIFTALVLERRMHRIDDVGYSLPSIAIVVGVMGGLILVEPDFGTAVSLLFVVGVMIFAAGLRYQYVVVAVVAMVPMLYLLLKLKAYRMDRLTSFWNPWADPDDTGYQAIQSLIAVGTGGVFGKGLTQGFQKLFWLPEAHNDFIYAVIGEELGFVGAVAVLACFCVIAWRGLRIALRAEESFGALVALGITTMISAQALINIGIVLSLLPTKGLPLPLVSAGGSSLVVSLLGIGVLLNISQHEAVQT